MHRRILILLILSLVPTAFAQSVGATQSATVTLTADQLSHLKASPVELVAAPGPGKVILDVAQHFQYKFGATPYSVAPDAKFSVYVSADSMSGGFRLNAAGFLDQRKSQIASGANTGSQAVAQDAENSPLMVANLGPEEFSGGDGTVTITVYYTVVSLQ